MIEQEAKYYKKENGNIMCLLCPHRCLIAPGKKGICGVRKNQAGKLLSLNYGIVSALHRDPVEKKPLYHFFPGSSVLSAGTFGCNFDCLFCQNHGLARETEIYLYQASYTHPGMLIRKAEARTDSLGLAYTYNEPVVWFEYIMDVAEGIKRAGLYNIMISNGYISKKPLNELIRVIDAFNIDLKGFSESFYKKYTKGSLKEVKESIQKIARSGSHLEITTLVIPGQNDDPEEFKKQVAWIADECGAGCVLHLSRYFPRYKSTDPATPVETLKELYDIAGEKLQYVYLGNTQEEKYQNTYCPNCGELITRRSGYYLHQEGVDREGNCNRCGTGIYDHFNVQRT